MYTRVRTYTRTRRKFFDIKSVLQHYQTEFHHQSDTIHFYYPIAVQSISILAPHWLCHLYKLLTSDIICCTFTIHYQPLPNYPHPFNHLSVISHLLSLPPIISHTSYSIFIWFPIQPIDHPINMSVCYKTLSILYIFAALLICFLIYNRFLLHQPHYNHFHYGNRIPSQSSAIPIMHNYSFIDFRNEIRLKPFCIIIHPNCINIHLFGFHYENHLLIIGFYYGIRLWDFIAHQHICVRTYRHKNNGTV